MTTRKKVYITNGGMFYGWNNEKGKSGIKIGSVEKGMDGYYIVFLKRRGGYFDEFILYGMAKALREANLNKQVKAVLKRLAKNMKGESKSSEE